MKDNDKPTKTDMTHAHWVAVWWARALSQMTAQAVTDKETFSFEALLDQFLNCNRTTIEDTAKTAQRYDADIWADLAEATKRKDTECQPATQLVTMDEHRRTRARNGAAEAMNAVRALKGGKGSGKGGKSQGRGGQSGRQSRWPYAQQGNVSYADRAESWRRAGALVPPEKSYGHEKTVPWMKKR